MAQRGPNQERPSNRIATQINGPRAYGREDVGNQGMVDIAQAGAGQNGFQTNLAGYVNNTAYVRKNLIAALIEAPRGFQFLPDSQQWVDTLKSLVELHAKSITGLNSTETTEFAENPVGGAGEQQEDLTNRTRERSVPSFVWTERYGKPINRFLKAWSNQLMMDPETKVPAIMSRNGQKPTDILPDFYSMTVLFLEPDPTMRFVEEAWLCTNMAPKSTGEVTGQRDLTAAGETVDYTIEFTALTQVGAGVEQFAQRYLDELMMAANNPNLKPAFVDEIESDVRAADTGYQNQMDDFSRDSIPATDPNTIATTNSDYDPNSGDAPSDQRQPDLGYTGTNYRTNGSY